MATLQATHSGLLFTPALVYTISGPKENPLWWMSSNDECSTSFPTPVTMLWNVHCLCICVYFFCKFLHSVSVLQHWQWRNKSHNGKFFLWQEQMFVKESLSCKVEVSFSHLYRYLTCWWPWGTPWTGPAWRWGPCCSRGDHSRSPGGWQGQKPAGRTSLPAWFGWEYGMDFFLVLVW